MRGDIASARLFLTQARKTFSPIRGADGETDFDMPDWRMHLTESRLLSAWGDPVAQRYQDEVIQGIPVRLTRVFTQIEMHRGLLVASQGDHQNGLDIARRALERLDPAKRSVTLDVIQKEIEKIVRNGA